MADKIFRRFWCDYPGCQITAEVMGNDRYSTPGWKPPEGWINANHTKSREHTHLCPEHAHHNDEFNKVFGLWDAAKSVIMKPAQAEMQRQYQESMKVVEDWQKENPRPRPPWWKE